MSDFGFVFDAATAVAAGLGGIGGGAYLVSLTKSKKKSSQASKRKKALEPAMRPHVSSEKLERIRSSSVSVLSTKAKEWEDLWTAYREFLKSVASGENSISTAAQITKMVDLLRLSRPVLPGHEPISDHGKARERMDLTHIIYFDKADKVWYRAPSSLPDEASYNLRKKVDEGLMEISDLLLRIPMSETSLHGEAREFSKNYAAHLLLNYRSTPNTRKSSGAGPDQGSHRKQRQIQLDAKMSDLIAGLREYVRENPDAFVEGVQDNAFREVLSLIEKESASKATPSAPEKKEPLHKVGSGLDLSVLDSEEATLLTRFQDNFEMFEAEEVKAVEKLLQKVIISAEVVNGGGDQFVPEMRERGIQLAEENRRFAITALAKIVDSRVLDRGAQLFHDLRVDNRYLSDALQDEGRTATA